jgi:Mrp family chromosome partitioning ATPase
VPADKTLISDTDIEKLILHDDVRGIDILPGGKHSNVLPASRLSALMTAVRGQYDWILLDCAPLLDDDTAQLALQHSDGVLIAVREDKSFYSRLGRTKALVEMFEVPAMTVVLNGAHNQPGEWLFTTVQSSLRRLSILHRKCQTAMQRIRRKAA